MPSDSELLNSYFDKRDESAFAELVRRHVDHVYSAALRLLNFDTHLAEDVTQAVFTEMARKAGALRKYLALSSWLHTTTRFASAKAVRSEQRRRHREQASLAMPTNSSELDPDWTHMRPVIDKAISELSSADRDALLLRFFEKKSYRDIGTALGLSENGARMRVDRATDKLRIRLATRGITSTAVAFGTALGQNIVAPAPLNLAGRVTTTALASGVGFASLGLLSWIASLSRVTKAASLALAAAIAVAIVAKVKSGTHPTQTKDVTVSLPSRLSDSSNAVLAVSAIPQSVPGSNTISLKRTKSAEGPELLFLDGVTGEPLPDQVIALRGWQRGSHTLVEKNVRVKEGRCIAPFDPKYGGMYWILTHIEEYADVRLRWQTDRGETVPDFYAVRLVKPALLHGRVVDPSGNSVPGATVTLGAGMSFEPGDSPQDFDVSGLSTDTDAEGRWTLNRIPPEKVRYILGDASHTNFARSERLEVSLHPEALPKLLDGTFTFTLGEPAVVQGIVVDPEHHPVANALVHVGMLAMTGSRDATTGPDGTFRILGCPLGMQPVTASADGFAPAVLAVELPTNRSPVELLLGQGQTLRLKLLDSGGKPIAGASAYYETYDRTKGIIGAGDFAQVEFEGRSDSQGLIVWEHAPNQDLIFDIAAAGFMRTNDVRIHPDREEHTITLSRSFVLAGTVRDADTGELLPGFQLSIGCIRSLGDGSSQPMWSTIDRFSPRFKGGEFRHPLEEGVIGGGENPGYVFRFEANGYAPQTTRSYKADEGEIHVDIRLRKAAETLIAVYTPDGQPAVDAHVGLMVPGNQLRLIPGAFNTSNGEVSPWLKKTDAEGHFLLPEDDSVPSIVIAHPQGFLRATVEEIRKNRSVRLQAWARIEGISKSLDEPVRQQRLSLRFKRDGKGAPLSPVDLMLGNFFDTQTDETGHFVFPQVPPGSLEIMSWRPEPTSGGTGFIGSAVVSVETRTGETSQIAISTPTVSTR
jgi:RNA polymerase sigma factor (sigma-70 family)